MKMPRPILLPALPAALLLAACRGIAPESAPARPESVELVRQLGAMGTDLTVRIWADSRSRALAASEQAVRAVERVEARLSTWTDRSELAAVNRAPVGEAVPLSAELARDLARARQLWRETGGAFDPSVGALVRAFGLRSGGRLPSPEELARARATVGFDGLELDSSRLVKHRAGLLLEEGGFGKGVGLDAARAALASSGARAAMLDLGGQVALFGERFLVDPAVLALADPRDRTRPVLELTLDRGSLATTGNSERGIVVEGVVHSHLLDPRRGELVSDFGSVTVWAPEATDADALSTALYVLGPEQVLSFARRSPRLFGAVLLELPERPGGPLRARLNSVFRGRARALVSDLVMHIEPPATAGQTP